MKKPTSENNTALVIGTGAAIVVVAAATGLSPGVIAATVLGAALAYTFS
jgi:Flp pilus assembly protein TadB